jgi:CDP-glucose 4,6-dehydratase
MAFDWYGRNVWISGGNGFVAGNLAVKLISLGANVHITVRHYSEYNAMEILSSKQLKYDTEITDMYSYTEINALFARERIDTIFHLAASAIVSQASNSPFSTLYNNIIPTINILEAARVNNIKRIIVASTDKSYGDHSSASDPERIPYKENYALRGLDVYGTSKVCVDMISQTMALQYKQPIFVSRCCNIYGPGDLNLTRLIPKTIMRILSNKGAVINEGNSRVLREFAFVDDIVSGYIFLAEHIESYYKQPYPQDGENAYGWPCFNVGAYTDNDFCHTRDLPNIKDVVSVIAMIAEIMQGEYNIDVLQPAVIPKGPHFIEIPDQYLNSSKIHGLGFKPQTNFREGLRKTIKWYYDNREFLKKYGAEYLT